MLCSLHSVSGQKLYEEYKKIVKKGDTPKLKSQVDSLMVVAKEQEDLFSYREIAHRYAIHLFRLREYPEAIRYTLIEIQNFEEHQVISKKYTNALYAVGRFYYGNLQYKKAIEYYGKVIKIDNQAIRSGQSYAEIGRNYDKMGNVSKALQYFKKGIRIIKKEKQYRSLINQYVNYAIILRKINTRKSIMEGLKSLRIADSLTQFTKVNTRNKLNLVNTIASFYTVKKNFDFKRAKRYYFEALSLAEKAKDSGQISSTYNNLSNLYNLEKKDSAKYFANTGLTYVKVSRVKARLYDNLCEYFLIKKQYIKALESIDKSLKINLSIEHIKDLSQNTLNSSPKKDYTLYCLKKKAEILIKLYKNTGEEKYLTDALKNISLANYLVELLLSATGEEFTQLVWMREASQAYLYGAYGAHLLGNAELAFSYMEKSKAVLLSEGILKNTEFQNLPKHVSDQETQLRKYIYELENKLANQQDKQLQDSLFNAKLNYENYVDSLKVQFPKYFDRKLNVTQVSLIEAQKDLQKDEVLISYIWNEFDDEKEVALGLVTTQTSSLTFEVSGVDSLQSRLTEYKKLISQPFVTQEDQQHYQRVAYQLYQQLIPEETRSSLAGKKLMIIPDGNLQNIPFEAFITSQEENSYLIQETDVSYSYSYSFLKYNEQVKRESNQSFIGYSPINFKELSSLQNSKVEVEDITAEFDGIAKIQDTATKEDFLQNSSQSSIIHLATHADAGKNPWIAFADDKLELHELYTYKNNADLVTLSACNTSLGEIAKGEGVLSLARGFFYSGSKSVVSSLWEVNDKSTALIMTSFYKNLKDGETKSEALNNAKRTYLNTHELSDQSPYYWSSFVLIGDAGHLENDPNYLLYIGIGLLILATIFFFRKKSKNIG